MDKQSRCQKLVELCKYENKSELIVPKIKPRKTNWFCNRGLSPIPNDDLRTPQEMKETEDRSSINSKVIIHDMIVIKAPLDKKEFIDNKPCTPVNPNTTTLEIGEEKEEPETPEDPFQASDSDLSYYPDNEDEDK